MVVYFATGNVCGKTTKKPDSKLRYPAGPNFPPLV